MDREALEYIIRIAGAEEVRNALKSVAGEAQGVGEETKKHPGLIDQGVSRLSGYIGAWQGIMYAARGFSQLLSQIIEQSERAAQSIKGMVEASGQLIQISQGSSAALKRMDADVRATRLQMGVSEKEAADLQFKLVSTGQEKYREDYAKWFGIADPSMMAESVYTLQTAFGKEDVGETPREVINKIAAAAQTSKTDIGEIGPESTTAAQSAKQVSASSGETLAILGVLTNALKSARIAATQQKVLNTKLVEEGLTEEGTVEGVKKIRDLALKKITDPGKSEKQKITEFLGSSEAYSAYSAILSNEGMIRKVWADVDAAAGTNRADKMTSLQEQGDRGKVLSKNRATVGEEIAQRETVGGTALVVDTMNAKMREAAYQNKSWWDTYIMGDAVNAQGKALLQLSGYSFEERERESFDPTQARSLRPATRGRPIGEGQTNITNIGVQYAPDQQNPVDAPRPVGPGGQ